MRKVATLLSVGVSLFSLSSAAFAQEGPPPTPEEKTPTENAAGEQVTQSSDENQVAQSAADQGVDRNQIVVTGTILRGAPPVGSNLISVGEERIESTGATTANELLATIPQATNLFNTVPNSQLSIAANQVQVVRPSLRGLSNAVSSSASTLVLFDGHRIAPVGTRQNAVDPDLIPAAAIERVEIVTDGGSATYGSDAVGGVINFITRKRFDGVKVEGQYGIADNYRQISGSAILGKDWGSGSVFASYTYQHNDAIFGRDRDFIRQIDWTTNTPIGRACNPGNVTVPGPIIFQIPGVITIFGPGATYALPNLTTTTSTPNACDASDDSAFVPRSTRHGAVAGLHQELADWLTVDLRAFYGQRTSDSFSPFRGRVDVAPTQAFYVPLAPNPVATQQVDFTFAPVLGRNPADSHTEFQEWGANAEFQAKLNDNWGLRTLFNYSRSNSEFAIQQINATKLLAAGAAANPAQAVNFYNLTTNPNLAVIQNIINSELAGQGKYDLFNARTILDGTLFALPGGAVKLAVGYEYLHDGFDQRTSPGSDALNVVGAIRGQAYSRYNRRTNAVFGELQVPIVGADNRVPGIYSLTVAGSVRYDHFSDFGSTTNPKIGITYKPFSWLGLRGNYSTSFNAPSPVDQLGSLLNAIGFNPFFNPFVRAGDNPSVTGALAIQGSQTNLRPQTAKTYSVGIDLDPPFISGLHASVNYYNIRFNNLISIPTPGPAIFVDQPNNVLADPTGLTVAQLQSLTGVAPNAPSVIATTIATQCPDTLAGTHCRVYEYIDFRTGNYGRLKTDGLDFSANYRMPTGFGGIDAGISGNYTLSRKQAFAGPFVDQLTRGRINAGRLLAQASLGADIGSFRAQATLNHVSGYPVVRCDATTTPACSSGPSGASLPQDKVGAFDTVNLFFKYTVPGESVLLKDLSFTLNVNNVLDQDPPVYKLAGSNGTANGFTLGRLIQFGVSKKF